MFCFFFVCSSFEGLDSQLIIIFVIIIRPSKMAEPTPSCIHRWSSFFLSFLCLEYTVISPLACTNIYKICVHTCMYVCMKVYAMLACSTCKFFYSPRLPLYTILCAVNISNCYSCAGSNRCRCYSAILVHFLSRFMCYSCSFFCCSSTIFTIWYLLSILVIFLT